jgi:hypothetical protein
MSKSKKRRRSEAQRRREEADYRRSRRMNADGFQQIELPNGGQIWFPDPHRPTLGT